MKSFFKKLDIFNVISDDEEEKQNSTQNNQPNQTPEKPVEEPVKKDEGVIIVNSEPIAKKEGYYYSKYKDKMLKLKLSKPIYLQRETMKVNFDKSILDYLFNDLNNIFKEKNKIVCQNQNELLAKINDSSNLINYFYEVNRSSDDNLNTFTKEKELMEQIDYLEIFINSLANQTDEMLEEINKIEKNISGNSK